MPTQRREIFIPKPKIEKVAFIIPGQGGQKSGMYNLANRVDYIAEAYEQTDEEIEKLYGAEGINGRNISEWAEHGTEDELADTRVTQPLLVATAVGLIDYITKTRRITADTVAGHSLGGLPALYAGGSLEKTDTLKLGIKRGQITYDTSLNHEGRMIALSNVTHMTQEFLDSINLGEIFGIVRAIRNSPDQVLLAGLKHIIEEKRDEWQRLLRAAKGMSKEEKRLLPQVAVMKIKGGFHSFLMSGAEKAFLTELQPIPLKPPYRKIPFWLYRKI